MGASLRDRAGGLRPEPLAESQPSRRSSTSAVNIYRGWSIHYDPPPIPIRSFDWQATHPDYDASYEGPEDGWVDNGLKCSAATLEELHAEIDVMQDEWNETNSQFGVGA